MTADGDRGPAREHFLGRGKSRLFVREVGHGLPIVVLHGGPDFDHQYLLPEMDRLADRHHLVYYDQRGRGRSYSGHGAGDVTMSSEIRDLDRVRHRLGLGAVTVLGHSWGGLLAMEYAIRHPRRVSHLVLLNTAPASHSGDLATRRELTRRRSPGQIARMQAIAADPRHRAGDVQLDVDFHRLHFAAAVRDHDQLERVVGRLRLAFTDEGIVAARTIERDLRSETLDDEGYDLVPALRRLRVRTLIIHGQDDFIPMNVARELADAIAGSLLVTPDCGHFAHLERPDDVQASIAAFLDPAGHPFCLFLPGE